MIGIGLIHTVEEGIIVVVYQTVRRFAFGDNIERNIYILFFYFVRVYFKVGQYKTFINIFIRFYEMLLLRL